jgi:hypothetical protein
MNHKNTFAVHSYALPYGKRAFLKKTKTENTDNNNNKKQDYESSQTVYNRHMYLVNKQRAVQMQIHDTLTMMRQYMENDDSCGEVVNNYYECLMECEERALENEVDEKLLQERLSQLSEKMNDLQDDIYQLPCMDE